MATCSYTNASAGYPLKPSQAEARLEHLEQLVQQLAQSRDTSGSNDQALNNTFVEQSNGNGTFGISLHNGATHWSAMLEDIEELRNNMRSLDTTNNDVMEKDSTDIGAGLLFGALSPLSFKEVLSKHLPSRQKVDQLVSSYFRMKTVQAPFLHTGQFQRLYKLFWNDPFAASPLWTSLLFSVLEIATKTMTSNLESSENTYCYGFGLAAAHCLAVGRYYRPQRFAVEALYLYAQSRCLANIDIHPDMAVLMGTLVSLATSMGYHRNGEGYQRGISVFEGEIRRRIWSCCMQLDLLISFLLGLPSNVQFLTWDSRPPTNLLDSDFDEDTVLLPPARPAIEPTELLFYIAKHRLMTVFEKVIRHTLSVDNGPSSELEEIDTEIRSTFRALPSIFQPVSMSDSILDSPSVKVTRICVHSIYQKSLCALHRKYVIRGRQASFSICHDSASELVKQLLDMYEEFQPGRQLETERWFMSSIGWHDFLLGCMALCLIICYVRNNTAGVANMTDIDVVGSLGLLRKAKAVCGKHMDSSEETRKVQRLIEATLQKNDGQNHEHAHIYQQSLRHGQDGISKPQWQPSSRGNQADKAETWTESLTSPIVDTGWAYLEHYLDLSLEDLMPVI